MNTKSTDDLLLELMRIDRELKTLNDEKDLLKKRIQDKMKADNRDQYISFNGTKVSRFTTNRVMYLKEKLQEFVPEAVLQKCTKTITIENLKISYPKEA